MKIEELIVPYFMAKDLEIDNINIIRNKCLLTYGKLEY